MAKRKKTAATIDPELAAVVSAWPLMPPRMRASFAYKARASLGRRQPAAPAPNVAGQAREAPPIAPAGQASEPTTATRFNAHCARCGVVLDGQSLQCPECGGEVNPEISRVMANEGQNDWTGRPIATALLM